MSAFTTPSVEATLPCGNCRATMRRLTLPGRYGMPVELDQSLAHEVLRPNLGCPRCGSALKPVHNQTRGAARCSSNV